MPFSFSMARSAIAVRVKAILQSGCQSSRPRARRHFENANISTGCPAGTSCSLCHPQRARGYILFRWGHTCRRWHDQRSIRLDDVPGSYSFTNVDIEVTGSGAQLGLNTTITSSDLQNPGGLCFADPPVGQALCFSTILPSLVLIFDQRLTPNSLDPTDPELLSDQICLGPCFGNDQSQFNFSDGTSVAITAGSITDTTVPEPSSLVLTFSGIGVALVMRKRIGRGRTQAA